MKSLVELQNLDGIYQKYLQTSNLYLTIDDNLQKINLTFIDIGTGIHTLFECRKIYNCRVTQDPDYGDPPYFVGEVTVAKKTGNEITLEKEVDFSINLPNKVWVINIKGTITMEIVCMELLWSSSVIK